MKKIDGGVTAAKGFEAAGVAAEIKYKNRTDMAIVYSQEPCQVAGTFTTNVVKAAPVKWDQQVVKESAYAQAVIINSGIANACTGAEGMAYCKETADEASKVLEIPADSVLVASTGVIGKQLPMDRIKVGVGKLAETKKDTIEAGTDAAKAIMTTDTCKKEIAFEIEIDGTVVTVGGMAKGSGMIHPNMCTMLSFITTDAAITKEALQKALSTDVNDTYNMISVDGDTSTNDTVTVMASGYAQNTLIDSENDDYNVFASALKTLCQTMAKKIAKDGEGATKLIECQVVGFNEISGAKRLAKSVIRSSLVKAAMFGADANWGRILCALGYCGVDFDPDLVDVYFVGNAGRLDVCKNGRGVEFDEDFAKKLLTENEITIICDMNCGDKNAVAWGCDLTYEYVKINGDYRT